MSSPNPAIVLPGLGESAAPRPRLSSEEILRGQSTVEIVHAGQCYLLRVTRENKLILTK